MSRGKKIKNKTAITTKSRRQGLTSADFQRQVAPAPYAFRYFHKIENDK